ncbi:hypothetical protein MJD09_09295 [bacterium]|nr:hypothetical protein [bacterium]
MALIIGVDLDNTIINYDQAFFRNALQLGLIDKNCVASKKSIRDRIRRLEDGDAKWHELQAIVYGPKIGQAELMPGVKRFFQLCRSTTTQVYIVSHKTKFVRLGEQKTNLREAALHWMHENGFFSQQVFGLSDEQVFFELERRRKIDRIKMLNCSHFIDDLEETFREGSFPENVVKLLFSPGEGNTRLEDVKVFTHWDDLSRFFFDVCN